MKFYVGVTDNQWFDYLRRLSVQLSARPSDPSCPSESLDEVNFWQPSPDSQFRAIRPGDLFLFKLHRGPRPTRTALTAHRDLIAGGGVLASYSVLPISLAWEAFGPKNGAGSYPEMRRQIAHYRRSQDNPFEDFKIGCIILTQPFFLDKSEWFPVPEWRQSIVRGKTYTLDSGAGRTIWQHLSHLWEQRKVFDLDREARRIEEERARYGKETTIRPRLGQGAFKVAVTDAYRRSCAITEEHSLPALEAAHIKPYGESGPHAVHNGLLLRSDVHRLFDSGYITVTPDYHIEVSGRLREEYENGRYYYPFHGHKLHHLPLDRADHPSKDLLIWHNEQIFRD
jgi:putative restriction endonuclease